MRFETVNQETQNKLFRLTKLQTILHEFNDRPERAIRIILDPGEYVSTHSAQGAYHQAIKRSKLAMKARILDGDLYLIKIL